MEDKPLNFVTIFNEYMLLLLSYFVFLFSGYVPDAEIRYFFGWVYIGLLVFLIVVNLVAIGYKNYRWFMRYRELKELKKNVESQRAV